MAASPARARRLRRDADADAATRNAPIRPQQLQRGRVRYLHDADAEAALGDPVTLFATADRHLAEHEQRPTAKDAADASDAAVVTPAEVAAPTAPVALRKASITRFTVNGIPLASRRYFRGGVMARVNRSTYLGVRVAATRMWREFHLLARARALGLPVPEPVAARCIRTSPVTYRGDLLTRWVRDTRTLTSRLAEGPLPPEAWHAIGRVLRRFHDAGVFHADLNADNVLLDDAGDVHLLDFDKGRLRPSAAAWRDAMLARLRRSLGRKRAALPGFAYDDVRDWPRLLAGLRGEAAG